MKSYIMLENMIVYANHGVYEQEQEVGNTFILNIKLKVDLQQASLTDELSDTISYADVYQSAKEEMQIPSKLLEHVAGRIIRRLKKEHPSIEEVEIKLSKRNPPFGGHVEVASVLLID